MAKKQFKKTSERSQRYYVALFLFLLVIIGAVAQISYNINTSKKIDLLNLDMSKGYVSNAISNLYETFNDLTDDNKIPELSLQLPQTDKTMGRVSYSPVKDENDEIKEVQLTTDSIFSQGMSMLNGTSHEKLYDSVPQAQACSRPFLLSFSVFNNNSYGKLSLVESKVLSNGKTLNIVRDNECSVDGMDNLENYLKSIDSY